jgi:hypothetical protein
VKKGKKGASLMKSGEVKKGQKLLSSKLSEE